MVRGDTVHFPRRGGYAPKEIASAHDNSDLNAGARYALTRHVQLVAQLNNVLDTHYYSASQLSPTGFTGAGNFVARPLPAVGGVFPVVRSTFYAPGAPATCWAGVRVSL